MKFFQDPQNVSMAMEGPMAVAVREGDLEWEEARRTF
jgi:hypothetical protein